MGSGDYVGILLWIYHCHEVSVDVLYPYPFTTFLCSGVIRDFFQVFFSKKSSTTVAGPIA